MEASWVITGSVPWRRPASLLATAAVFVAPYGARAWWSFVPATIAILLLARARDPQGWKRRLGLPTTTRAWLATAGVAAVCAAIFAILIGVLARRGGVTFDRSQWSALHHVRPLFQAFNEELLFRGALLAWLLERRPVGLRLCASVAGVFALAHLGFYAVRDSTLIGPGALASYFLFGLLCNLLALRTGHVGYAFALHVGWNLTRFAGQVVHAGTPLSEGESVALFEGSAVLFVPLFALAAIACLWPRQEAPRG